MHFVSELTFSMSHGIEYFQTRDVFSHHIQVFLELARQFMLKL